MKRLTNTLLKEIEKEAREHLLGQIENSLSKKFPEHFEIYRKITDVDKLPERNECIRLMRKVDGEFGGGVYGELLMKNGYFQVVHDNLANGMANLISLLGTERNIEVCAGNGKLSHWINMQGIEITATDSGRQISGDARYVKKIDYREALRKFNPQTVVAAWPMPMGIGFVSDILRHKSVKNLIILGKGGYIARKHWKKILKYGEIVPLDLVTSPSAADSKMNNGNYGTKVEKTIKKYFQVGKSAELHQSVLIKAIRK